MISFHNWQTKTRTGSARFSQRKAKQAENFHRSACTQDLKTCATPKKILSMHELIFFPYLLMDVWGQGRFLDLAAAKP
jgi:SPX domain protein involved in polyphosphate accumulation